MTEVLKTITTTATTTNKMQIQKCAAKSGNSTANDHCIEMGAANRCAPATPIMDGSGDSPSRQPIRSPRCEAFLMTGDKMLNLNPKISPCYAKIYQNQLPPSVEIDSEEKDSLTPIKRGGPFDQFPSMHKNSCGKSARDTNSATNHGAIASPVMPAASNSGNGTGLERNEEKNSKNFDNDSGTNIVPADPSNIMPYHHQHQASMSTLSENLTLVEVQQHHHPTEYLPYHTNHLPADSKKTSLTRFIANQSQSSPSSPAHTYHQPNTTLNNDFMQQQFHGSNWNSSTETEPAQSCLIKSSTRLARHLFTHQEGIKIAAFLVKSDDLSLQIAREFVSLFNFAGIRVDAALRTFLSHVCLTGESGERAQLLSHFAHRYHECNPTVFNSTDEIHALSCALLLLNTDLHGKQNNKKMSCRDFIENLAQTDYKYNAAMLKELYMAVKEQPFHYRPGEIPPAQLQSPLERMSIKKEKRMSRIFSMKGSASSSVLVNPEQQVDYKHGWLLKKSVYDADGKKTPIGRRKWQMLYATLRGMILYLHQNENSFSSGRYAIFHNCICLHHSFAEIPRDYKRRKNVFQLKTANLGEILFQTSSSAEVQKWIDTINYVAAAFSTPALPTPVGSNGVVAFYRPHLPSMPTHLSISDQLRSHEQRLDETVASLSYLRENAPSVKSKNKIVLDYFYKERFLDKERERYSIYVKILREKLANATSKIRGESQSTNMLSVKTDTVPDGAANGNGNSAVG